MKTSQIGLDLIIHFEGIHDGDLSVIGLQPKMDPVGIWTEGYGRAMRDDKGNFIRGVENKKLAYSRITIHTEKEAIQALIEDVKPFELQVLRKIKVALKQQELDALVCFFYNTGGSNTLSSMINNKSNPELIKLWWESHYIMGGGKILKGLQNRRKAETKLYFAELKPINH